MTVLIIEIQNKKKGNRSKEEDMSNRVAIQRDNREEPVKLEVTNDEERRKMNDKQKEDKVK